MAVQTASAVASANGVAAAQFEGFADSRRHDTAAPQAPHPHCSPVVQSGTHTAPRRTSSEGHRGAERTGAGTAARVPVVRRIYSPKRVGDVDARAECDSE